MTALTLVAHALTPALRGLVLGGAAEPDAASLEAARELKLNADEVFAGPEPAAVKTAEALGLTPKVEVALRDREYGDWTGRSLEELLTADPQQVGGWLEHPHTAPPGGESANDVLIRVADWLGDLSSASEDGAKNVVAVVHPAVVRAAVLYVLEAPAESLRHVDVRPLSVVHLSAHTGAWSLVFG
ncbi:histidine phosphatase family protein [Kribbella qitaiheensis]|uniref:Histidine phosphatase family protein n=1 Tax=Kribbella qitaiheensis TaxID=1544730 RepID=A0A7G6X0F9_9ACTN|nr:histidine phosphatase family protein [Kribbella qitaiheensis]QNE19724.1 histidine phosphatase family protein [Kribbella qitaiheensis]